MRTIATGDEHAAEMVTPDGRAWLVRAAPVKDDQGEVLGAVEVTLEITDWKRAERALRSSEQRYRTLFENSPTALWEEDFSRVWQYLEGLRQTGIDDFGIYLQEHPEEVLRCVDLVEVTEANQAAMDLYATRDLAEFRRVSNQNVKERTSDVFKDALVAVAEGVREFGFEYATASALGEERFLQLTWSVAPGCERPFSKVLVSVVDLTERKKAEDAVRRAELQLRRYSEELEQMVTDRTVRIQELERQRGESEKLAATGRMAARIAHEINNPLAGIKNAFLLVRDTMDKQHPHFAYADLIEKEIDRIANIIRRMFDLYSPDRLKAFPQNITDAVRDVAGLLDSTCRAAGVELRIEVPSTPITIKSPSGYINQILFNLIQNAIEASKPGDVIKVSSEVKSNSIILSVIDQGRGIPKEAAGQIFEPFFTTKDETDTPGLGLGLSVSKGMAEAMGGSITFKSQPSGGTLFALTLPRTELQKEV
jgi:signal transduction histidine kinase